MREDSFQSLLASYPRRRPPLTPNHEKIYVKEYKQNRSDEGLFHRAARYQESWMHKMVADRGGPGSILELGAGSLNHLPYEASAPVYDCVEPFRKLNEASAYRAQIRNLYEDISDIPACASYDRILSVAVLEHLEDLPLIVAQCGLMLNDMGVFQGGIPTEGGFLWGLSWRLTSGVSYRLRTGLDYSTVMRHEQVNTAPEIVALVGFFFSDIRIWRFPMLFFHLSFYTYIEARNPVIRRCRKYLARRDRASGG